MQTSQVSIRILVSTYRDRLSWQLYNRALPGRLLHLFYYSMVYIHSDCEYKSKGFIFQTQFCCIHACRELVCYQHKYKIAMLATWLNKDFSDKIIIFPKK